MDRGSRGEFEPRHPQGRRASFLQALDKITQNAHHSRSNKKHDSKHGDYPRRPNANRSNSNAVDAWFGHRKGNKAHISPKHQDRQHASHPQAPHQRPRNKNRFIKTLHEEQTQHRLAHPYRKGSVAVNAASEPPSPKTTLFLSPTPPQPAFGFEAGNPWTQDDFLLHFVSSEAALSALQSRILGFSEPEQHGIVRYLFTSPVPIPIGSYSSTNTFQVTQSLNDFALGSEKLARQIATVFYGENTFLFLSPSQLVDFVANAPSHSMSLIRRVQFGSQVVRRPPGARDHDCRQRTQEDLDVETALAKLPGLESLRVMLGYDIDDAHHRHVIGDDWCVHHPNLPALEYARLDAETAPWWSGDKTEVDLQDLSILSGWFQILLNRARQDKAERMEIDDA